MSNKLFIFPGVNPFQLRGKKLGVFIGSTFSESEKIVLYENVQHNGFGITGLV